MNWFIADEQGHVPGVAAELPPGARVLLDGAGNIGAIECPVLESSARPQVQAEQVATPTSGDDIKEEI